jgi:site-specific recombinase XerD
VSIVDAYRSFLLAQGRNPNTIRAYCSSADRLLDHAKKAALEIEEPDVVSFLNSIDSVSSRTRHTYALKSFFSYLNKLQVVRLQAASPERSLDWWLRPGDIARLIQVCHLPRDRAIIGVGYTCALRNG